jgi:hypothetical protein
MISGRVPARHATDRLTVMNQYVLTGTLGEALISSCDTKVAVWQSLLPAVKKDPMRKDGTVDEMIFMAHVITSMYVSTTTLIPPQPLIRIVYY